MSTSVAQASPPIAIRTRSERATRNLVYLIVVLPVALGSLLALPTLVFGRTLSWRLATLERVPSSPERSTMTRIAVRS